LAGSAVNLEADVLAKYAERMPSAVLASSGSFELTTAYLISNGY
jgi:riboflavin synthase alpha subunit